MRLYARQISGEGNITVELPANVEPRLTAPHPNDPELIHASLHWPELIVQADGLQRRLGIELQLGSGSLYIRDAALPESIYHVAASLDADCLRLKLYEALLAAWAECLQNDELQRPGLDMLEHLRRRVFWLQESLSRPEPQQYQFL